MAHFAKLDENNNVLSVHVVDDSWLLDDEGNSSEANAIAKLEETHGWPFWKQTSYNTHGGVYCTPNSNPKQPDPDQTKAFRKNYARIGGTYNATIDGFISPQPFSSWILDETTGFWEAPVERPEDGSKEFISWDENNLRWIGQSTVDEDATKYRWDASSSTWIEL